MAPYAYTAPEVFAAAEAGESWADPETDPTRIDWEERRARALIPFRVVDGRPVNPVEPDLPGGRNHLGHWGEQGAADAFVTVTDLLGNLRLALIDRDDELGWALPGGYIEPGETPLQAAAREQREEIPSLKVPPRLWRAAHPRYVPDPRGSREAWMVTVLCKAHLGTMTTSLFPKLTPGSDADDAVWVPANSYDELAHYVADVLQGKVFPAHIDMLKGALG